MDKKGTPLNRRKSRKSIVTPCETKKPQKTPPVQKTPLEKHIHHPKKRNLNSQKKGETEKENRTLSLNSVNLNDTFGTETSKDTPKPSFSSVHFEQTPYKKISTDSDIEFSNKMKQSKQINVETNKTRSDLNNRKSVRFMPTTLIRSSYITSDTMEDKTPEKFAVFKGLVEHHDGSSKCAKRKSTPFVKRSKSSVITIDSTTTTESDVSTSSQNHPNNSSASITPMKTSTKRHSVRSASISTEKSTRHIAAESTPYERSMVRGDRLKRKSSSPQKYSCINLVTPSRPEHSLRREGTFLVDSPSIVVMDDTKSKIQDSFNESKTDPNSTKRQRKKWDKSGVTITSCSILEENPSPKKIRTEKLRKKWNKSFENSGFSPLESEAPPKNFGCFDFEPGFNPRENPPGFCEWFDDFNKNLKKISNRSTPLKPPKINPIPSENLLIESMMNKNMSEKAIRAKVKTCIPNFSRIHQKNFQKMESIKDLVERKAKRAELLLSGQKPPKPDSSAKDSNIRKHLKYSPKKQSATVSANGVSKINVNPSTKTENKLAGVKITSKPIVKKVEAAKADRKIVKPTKRRSLENQKNGFTKFGFKVSQIGVKKVSKQEQAKAVATKTKVGANTTDKRRILTQNVRTNRRFDLLMEMRNKNK